MTDSRLRALERRFHESGDPTDELAYLQEQVRTGASLDWESYQGPTSSAFGPDHREAGCAAPRRHARLPAAPEHRLPVRVGEVDVGIGRHLAKLIVQLIRRREVPGVVPQ